MLSSVELSRLIAECQTSKESWNSCYFEAMAYTQPERNTIWRVKGGFPANNKQVPLYTQAGKNGTNIFVARVQNKLSPYLKPYISFVPKKSLDSSYVQQLRDFCSNMSDKCNELKNELRLDDELNESYYDLACGTGMIMREDTLYGIRFRRIPFTDYSLGTEAHQTVCRRYKMPACKVVIMFPELLGIKEIGGIDVNGINKYEEVELNDILYYNVQTRMYEYYLRYEAETLVYRNYRTSPYHLFHWTRASDMPFGTGVALIALPAMKRLNSYVKVKLELIPFAFPMFLTQSGNFMDRNVQFKPGGIINVRNINAMQPVTLSKDTEVFKLEIQDEELQIKQTFLDYTLPTNPRQMTAAEVYARSNPQDEMVAMNVSKLTEVIKELAWDLFDDVFNREIAGTVSFSLDQIRSMIDVEINNDATLDANLIDKINGYISTIGQFDPAAIWQSLNRGKTLEAYGNAYNLPIDIRYTAEEIDEAQAEAAQAEADQMNAQIEAQMAINSAKEQDIANREIAKQEAKNG